MSLAYACSCLNVRLHVASSIDTSAALTDELGPELTGWKLPLGVGGIVIEQKPLVRLRQVSHAPSWATLSCLVCGTHDVFSVRFDDNYTHLHHPDWEKLLIPESNNIIVHKGLKDTTEIETLKQQSNYSRAFRLVIRPTDDSQTASNTSDHPEFSKLRDELQLTFTKAVKLEDEKTRERIEEYKMQQEEELVTFRENAQTDLQRLEAMISESLQKPKRNENKEDKGENTNQDDKAESSDYMSSSGILKKSIARQRVRFEESDQTGTSSKLVERHEHTSNLGQAIEERRVTSDDNTNFEENEGSEDEEDMFELDEELETHADGNILEEDTNQESDQQDRDEDKVESDNTNFLKSSSLPASSPLLMKAHRRNSQKYRAGNTWDEIQDKDDSIGDSQDLTMYATSLPITINRLGVKPSPNVKDSDQADKEETTIGSNNNKVLHFGTYDPAQRDLAASAQFQSSTAHPLNPHKSSASRSFNRTLVDGSLRHNQSDEDDDDDSGPMIPPHILAAQTYVDETEELFGTVPDTDR